MLYGINWNTERKKQVAKKSSTKIKVTKKFNPSSLNGIIGELRSSERLLLEEILALWRKEGLPLNYPIAGTKIVHDDESEALFLENEEGQRIIAHNGKWVFLDNDLGGVKQSKKNKQVAKNAQDLKLGALLIKQGKITKMPMPTLAKAIKRWHESGMQTKMEDFINNDMKKNKSAYKAKTKKKKEKKAVTKKLKKQAKKKAKKQAKKVVAKKKVATKTKPTKKVSVKKKLAKTQIPTKTIIEDDLPF